MESLNNMLKEIKKRDKELTKKLEEYNDLVIKYNKKIDEEKKCRKRKS